MKQHITNFPKYLKEGYEIGQKIDLAGIDISAYSSLVFVGMGGSALSLSIMKTLADSSEKSIPTQVVREYTVPNRVNEKTLLICASYSGNTEETVHAMKDALEKGAKMIALTSGGILKEFAQSGGHVLAEMPTGIEPRAAMPYSFGIQLVICEKLGLIEDDVKESIDRFAEWTEKNNTQITITTTGIAKKIADAFPFFYTTTRFAPVALRAEQQLQENSRMQCHHHLIPEQNHNELLARQEMNDRVHVIWLKDEDAYVRNHVRMTLTEKVLKDRGIPQHEIRLEGDNDLKKICTGLYQVDRLSFYTAEVRGVDPSGMALIERLKGELKKLTGTPSAKRYRNI